MIGIFAQLKRRNVFRVAAAYVIVGWIVLQVGDLLFGMFGAPDWVGRSLAIVLLLGFPIACVFAWAFELTPEGVKRTVEVDEAASITARTGRKLDLFILVALVALIGITFWLKSEQPAPPPATVATPTEEVGLTEPAIDSASIAVLPFVNMSEDPAQEYFSDGISEEILNVLAGIDGLRVASRTSAFAFKDSPLRLPEIAGELEVAFILEGSVRKAANQVRITAQLIDTRDDRHLWSDTFDRSLEDIFAIQSEIANAIGAALLEPLGMDIAPVEARAGTVDLDAYDLYLKGREAWLNRSSQQDLRDSIGYLEQAVELDPEFIDAIEELANVYGIAMYWAIEDRSRDWYMAQIEALTNEVLARDPNRPLALVTRQEFQQPDPVTGFINYLKVFEQALQIDPAFASGWHWKGQMLSGMGYLDEGLVQQERCLELEPHYINCRVYRDVVLAALGRGSEAMSHIEEYILEGRGDFYSEHFWATWDLGRQALAVSAARSMEHWSGAPIRELVLALRNPAVDRQRVVAAWDQWAGQRGISSAIYNDVLASLGAHDRVDLQWVTTEWIWLPTFKAFRNSPEFKAMAAGNGFLATWRTRGFPPQCRPLEGDDFECD